MFCLFFAVIAPLAVMSTLIVSMWADVTEDLALRTGVRLEGIVMAASSFARKAVGGLGNLLAGLVLRAVDFPTQAKPGEVSDDKVFRLVALYVTVVILTSAGSIGALFWYDIDRERHRANLNELERRRRHAAGETDVYTSPDEDDASLPRSMTAGSEAAARQRPPSVRWPHGAQEKVPLV